ncbi:MAG: DUF2807 domain-containing protein [Bacteroidales bacterium]|nr:DUF2807 domain-containing protein [Bacteroidales bacterium]
MLMMCLLALLAQAQEIIEVKVGDFTSLNVGNSVNVVYRADAQKAGTAVMEATQQVAGKFIFKNDGKGKLTIQLTDYSFTTGVPTVTVYSSTLQEVVNQSDSTVTIEQLPAMPIFKAKTHNNGSIIVHGLNTTTTEIFEATGKGHIQADGVTESLRCKIVGTGKIHALQLQARDITCSINGSGHVYCHSTGGKLMVKGMGTGRVHYTGTPSEIKTRKLGTLKAIPYEE